MPFSPQLGGTRPGRARPAAPHSRCQIVNVHVVQRAAQTGRVKGGVPDALQVVIVPGAAGAEAGHRAAHLTDLGQLGLQKGVLRQVGDRDGLHQHQPLGVRQGKQFPRLGRCGGEGLFQQHMIPRLQRPLGRRIMQVVGRADVHGIEPARRVGCGSSVYTAGTPYSAAQAWAFLALCGRQTIAVTSTSGQFPISRITSATIRLVDNTAICKAIFSTSHIFICGYYSMIFLGCI